MLNNPVVQTVCMCGIGFLFGALFGMRIFSLWLSLILSAASVVAINIYWKVKISKNEG